MKTERKSSLLGIAEVHLSYIKMMISREDMPSSPGWTYRDGNKKTMTNKNGSKPNLLSLSQGAQRQERTLLQPARTVRSVRQSAEMRPGRSINL